MAAQKIATATCSRVAPWLQQEKEAQQHSNQLLKRRLQELSAATQSAVQYRLMDMKTSAEEAKRRKLSADWESEERKKRNEYEQFMRKQSAFFVYQASNKLEQKLIDEDRYVLWTALLAQRDKCWNQKAIVIAQREQLENQYSRATTARQMGEKDAEELYNAYYKQEEEHKTAQERCQLYQEEFEKSWSDLNQKTKSTLMRFMKKVDEFAEKAKELYEYEAAEEPCDPKDKKFQEAWCEFEASLVWRGVY